MRRDRPMVHSERLFFGATLLGLVLQSSLAHATECVSATHISPCFDADTLWIPAAPSHFVSIPESEALAPRRYSLGLGVAYLSRPVVLKALSPDPGGRNVFVVDDVVDLSLAAAYAPVRHLELGAVLPMALHRTGTGLAGVTSQGGSTLAAAALRDIRIGAGYDLARLPVRAEKPFFTAMTRLDLALPTGNEDEFAGDRGPVLAPSITLGFRLGRRFRIAAQEGARFRSAVDFGGARIGTQMLSSLGGSVDVGPDGRFWVAVEAWVLPNFLSTKRAFPDGAAVTSGAFVPAEWLVSAWARLSDVSVGLGGGSAILLSRETRSTPDGTESTEYFAGATTPRFRFVLTARYTPGPT